MEIHWAVVVFLKYDKNGQILSVYFNVLKKNLMIFDYPLIFFIKVWLIYQSYVVLISGVEQR